MFSNIGWDILFEDDGGELKYDREDIWDPVIPGFTWKTADEFFGEDQFIPPFFRGDDDQKFSVVIIKTDDEDKWVEETGKQCFRNQHNNPDSAYSVEASLTLAVLASVTVSLF
jgi:hypothetical protein